VNSYSQEHSGVLISKNETVTNTTGNQASNQNEEKNAREKRKQMLSYMGNSEIYDFVDYTNPDKGNGGVDQLQETSKFEGFDTTRSKNMTLKTVDEEDVGFQKKHTEIEKLQEFVSDN
jgi:hypothetical protein